MTGLSFPTSIDFTPEGDAYVTINGVGAPGSGELVKYSALTSMEGTPAASMPETPAQPADAGAGSDAESTTAETSPENLPTTGAALPASWLLLLVTGGILALAGFLLSQRLSGARSRRD